MLSRSRYVFGGISVFALSFIVTLFALNSRTAHSPRQPPPIPPLPSGNSIHESSLADLPKIEAPGLQWIGIAKLNVRTQAGTSMVTGQPILLLIPTKDDYYHTLAGQLIGLHNSQGYRVTAWVKPEAGGNIELEVSDDNDGKPVNHAVGIFDLTRHMVLYG